MFARVFILSLTALQLWQAFALQLRQVPLQMLIADPDAVPPMHDRSSEVPVAMVEDQQSTIQRTNSVAIQDTLQSAWREVSYAIETMQKHYFQIWIGTWPSAIDWTAAVMGTHINAIMHSLSRALGYELTSRTSQQFMVSDDARRIENDINKYFSQAITYFFGENALAVRNQAFDDMLWIVLGWLENLRFMELHTEAHRQMLGNYTWYGNQFADGFAHRARVFYSLALKGWDERECGGGMNWNPRLETYKNAITNQLFITASASMFLYFPGDENDSPYRRDKDRDLYTKTVPAHAEYFLKNAVVAYDWLKKSGMKNEQGLYIDGFHVRNGECVVRNEMVYTYNQGVILTGLRGLWEATGDEGYLQDGYRLIRNTISATGYSLENEPGRPPLQDDFTWRGLGRNGIVEDHCDSDGNCSQDGQTFKGIYFHHLSKFCEALPVKQLIPGVTHTASPELLQQHSQNCKSYAPWVVRNAVAAMRTRNADGKFGMWWGFDKENIVKRIPMVAHLPDRAEDYRNFGLGNATLWGTGWSPEQKVRSASADDILAGLESALGDLDPATRGSRLGPNDENDRGRGRTLESQSGGVAVVRAMWEFIYQHNYVQ